MPGDARHDDALAMLDRLGPHEQVLTTNQVVGETWTFLRRRGGHTPAIAFLDRIEALETKARLVVHHVTEQQEQNALSWLRRRDERVYSFVDATSFQAMRERRLREVLAFDEDFQAAGFVELRP